MKNLKRYLCLVITVILTFTMFVIPYNAGADYTNMRDITAYDLVNEMNAGISIGNSLDSVGNSSSTNETSWGNPKVTKDLILAYKKAGFNTIRLPVTWQNHMSSTGVPTTSWINRVKEIVDWILEEDLYCILNTHHEGGWLHTSETGMADRKDKFGILWTSIANKFKDYGDHLLFEGYNEIQKKEGDWSPASETDYKNANILSQVFVDAVRATGGNNTKRTLIISTYGAIHETYGFELPKDIIADRLAVEFHCYYPQQFCFVWGTQKTWGSKSDLATVEAYCETFYDAFSSKKIPVILGEFGAVNKNNADARAAYTKTVAQNCKKYKIKPVWWDNGDTGEDLFGVVNRYNYEITAPKIISELIDNSESIPFVTTTTTTTTTTKPTTTTTKYDPSVDDFFTEQSESTTVTTQSVPTQPTQSQSVPTQSATQPTQSQSVPTQSATQPTQSQSITNATLQPTTKPTVMVQRPTIGKVTGIRTEFESVNNVKISWAKVDDADGYVIYKASGDNYTEYLGKVYKNSFSMTLARGSVAKFKILPFKVVDNITFFSDYSSEISVSVLAAKLSTVTKSVAKKQAKFNVKEVVGAFGYEIRYSLKKNYKKEKVKTSANGKFTLKKLKRKTKYYAKIRAYTMVNGKKVYTSYKKVNFKTK